MSTVTGRPLPALALSAPALLALSSNGRHQLRVAERALTLTACGLAAAGGWFDLDHEQWARDLRVSLPTLFRTLRALRAAGILEQKRPRSPLWRINPNILEVR